MKELAFAMCLISVLVAGCGQSVRGPAKPVCPKTASDVVARAQGIVGTWVTFKIEGDEEIDTMTYTFGKDGSLSASVLFKDGEQLDTGGEYVLVDNILKVRYTDKPKWKQWRIKLDQDTLVFEEEGPRLLFRRK